MKLMQDRKGVSIAYFNSINSAIALVSPIIDKETDLNVVLEKVFEIRDKMLDEYAKYHKNVIQSIGANYKAEDTIKKVEAVKTKQELSDLWKMLSEDERRDGEIRKVVQVKRDSLK